MRPRLEPSVVLSMLRGVAVAVVLVAAAFGLKLLIRRWAATDADAYFLSSAVLTFGLCIAFGRLEVGLFRADKTTREARRSERLMRRAFEVTPTPMFVVDHETSIFLAVNDAALQFFNLDRERFMRLGLEGLKSKSVDVEMQELPQTFEGRAVRLVLVSHMSVQRSAPSGTMKVGAFRQMADSR